MIFPYLFDTADVRTPTITSASLEDDTLTISLTAGGGADTTIYRVYYKAGSSMNNNVSSADGYIDSISTFIISSGFIPGTNYYLIAVERSSDGDESGLSNEVNTSGIDIGILELRDISGSLLANDGETAALNYARQGHNDTVKVRLYSIDGSSNIDSIKLSGSILNEGTDTADRSIADGDYYQISLSRNNAVNGTRQIEIIVTTTDNQIFVFTLQWLVYPGIQTMIPSSTANNRPPIIGTKEVSVAHYANNSIKALDGFFVSQEDFPASLKRIYWGGQALSLFENSSGVCAIGVVFVSASVPNTQSFNFINGQRIVLYPSGEGSSYVLPVRRNQNGSLANESFTVISGVRINTSSEGALALVEVATETTSVRQNFVFGGATMQAVRVGSKWFLAVTEVG